MMATPHANVTFRLDLRTNSSDRPGALCAGTLFCFYLDGIEKVRTEKSHG